MSAQRYETISSGQLDRRMTEESPNNTDPKEGFALVNVLAPRAFEEEHIPNSINIPGDELERFEERFDKDKEIVVYCASTECDASPKAAEELSRRGFGRVQDYEAGLRDWKESGHAVASGAT